MNTGLRRNTEAGYNAYYVVNNEKLVLNAKNVDLGLNMGQGIIYDIWDMSKKYNYPFPSTGLTSPYPYPEGIDWTVINPKPKEKTFFEFAQTFYRNMINVRNRQTITDGKGGGYPNTTISLLEIFKLRGVRRYTIQQIYLSKND